MLAGAALPLARVLVAPMSTLPGDPRGDVYKHAWSFWHATVAPGLHTDLLNAPVGGLLLDVMWLPSRLLLPLTLVAGPAFTSNLWVLLSLTLIGLSTWALCRELGASSAGSLVAGLAAQTTPYVLGYPLFSGVHERLTLWVFPLLVLSLLRLGREGRWRWAALAVGSLAFATAGCQNYGVFALPLVAATLPLLWKSPYRARLAITLLGLGAVLVGLYGLVRWAADHPHSLAAQPGRVQIGLGQLNPGERLGAADLLDPRTMASRHGIVELADRLSKLTYVGWAPLLLALIGALRARTPAVIGALVLSLLAMQAALGTGPVHTLLRWTVPGFGGIPAPWQLLALTGPLLGVGLAWAVKRPSVAAAALTLILVERVLVLPFPIVLPTADASERPVYAAIDGHNVLAIPRAHKGGMTAPAEVFWSQTWHHRPMPIAINVGATGADRYAPVLDGRGTPPPLCLSQGGLGWVLVYEDWLAPDATVDLGEPVMRDGTVALYALEEPEPSGFSIPITAGGNAGDTRMRRTGCPWNPPPQWRPL